MNFGPEYDSKHAYLEHRKRVERAKAIIDNISPHVLVKNFARFTKLKEDVLTAFQRNEENFNLLVGLNRVERTRGYVDSFRSQKTNATAEYSKLRPKCRMLDVLDMMNMRLGKRVLCKETEVKSWLEDKYKKKVRNKKKAVFKKPSSLLAKYSNIEIPRPRFRIKRYFQPKIWWFLEVKGIRPLGRVVIELYTVAAPQVVLEFLRLCYFKQKERLNFVRLFPSLWLQGELKVADKSLVCGNIEFDKRVLDNGQYSGVLSFSVKTLRRCASKFVPFTISFKPLSVCNEKRVAFGRICSGLKVLRSIEYFGTKNGKPKKDIIISSCGVLRR